MKFLVYNRMAGAAIVYLVVTAGPGGRSALVDGRPIAGLGDAGPGDPAAPAPAPAPPPSVEPSPPGPAVIAPRPAPPEPATAESRPMSPRERARALHRLAGEMEILATDKLGR